MPHEGDSFYEDFYPRGWRKFFAITVICLTSFVPALTAWKEGPDAAPQSERAFAPRFSGPGGFGAPRRGGVTEPRSSLISRLRQAGLALLAISGGVLGLMIYYPHWGFKRYALLCGPILGLGSMMLVSWYLTGRTKVYRFESVFAALIGGFPGVSLYVLLARRKWHKKHKAETLWIE